MSFTSLLKDTCTVRRFTEGAANAYGTPVKTWSNYLTDEACRLQSSGSISGGREFKVGAEVVVADNRLYIGLVDITEQDRVIIDSITYEILLVEDFADAATNQHKRCWLKVVR